MEIEAYFEQFTPDDIRIKGTRIGIESVLYEFIYREQTPQAIAMRFPSLTLEQIFAAILYYLQNKSRMEDYMKNWLTFSQEARVEQGHNPPQVLSKLRLLKKQHESIPVRS